MNKKGVYQLSKEEVQKYLDLGMSSYEIEKATGVSHHNVLYYIKKYNLVNVKYCKPVYTEDFFSKVDTKEKAYLLGFFLVDGCIDKEGRFEINIAMADKEILYFAEKCFGGRVREDYTADVKHRRFPSAGMKIGNKPIVRDLGMLFGGRKKEERHVPIIKRELEPFLVQGFFDAEGCVSFGKKKSGQLWRKITFTSQLKMLEGLQRILDKNDISTMIHPKSGENCYIMEIRSKEKIKNISDIIYSNKDFVVLKRKYDKLTALRLELGENGEGHADG